MLLDLFGGMSEHLRVLLSAVFVVIAAGVSYWQWLIWNAIWPLPRCVALSS
jgi:hypothetical protein